MENYERDILVHQIKSGYTYLNRTIKLKPMSIDLYNESMLIYQDAYAEALSQELFTVADSIKYLEITGFYTPQDKINQENLEKQIKSLQIDLYNQRKNKKELDRNKKRLDSMKSSLDSIINKQYSLYENTCEYYSESEKIRWLLPRLLSDNSKKIKYSSRYLQSLYNKSIISENKIRELCLNDPWRTIWILKDQKPTMAHHENCELNFNQKNLLLWSITYDNVRQSIDAPEDNFYQDNHVIDAWFVWVKDKNEKEKRKSETENKLSKNSKINSASHVFLMADPDNPESVNDIYDLNGPGEKMYIQNLNREIQSRGGGSLFNMPSEINRSTMSKN